MSATRNACRGAAAALGLCVAAAAFGCVPLPLIVARGVEGTLVDARTGQPLEEAIVVVRFESRYDDVLPDAAALGHREAITDAQGHFVVPPLVVAGFRAWPWMQIRARVVTARHAGHRCAAEGSTLSEGPVQLALEPAADETQERSSCRPVAAEERSIERYAAAWRSLHATRPPLAGATSAERERERTARARGALGFGANCHGPVLDLALAPGGERAALLVRAGSRQAVRLVEPRGIAGAPSREVARLANDDSRRLMWTAPGELALHAPGAPIATASDAAGSNASFDEEPPTVVWRESLPAAADPEALPEPADITSDASRFAGRSFEMLYDLDPATGLPAERLRVTEPDGIQRTLRLPGEPCRTRGFEPLQYRIGADGTTALDLRFVEGACHAVAIDVASGRWARLDAAARNEKAVCTETRRIPRTQLESALPGYFEELGALLERGGFDPASSFALAIGPAREVTLQAVDLTGTPRSLRAPELPVSTPLLRIEVSTVTPPPALRESAPALPSAPPAPELRPL